MTYSDKVKNFILLNGSVTIREAETVLEINSPSRPIQMAVAALKAEGKAVRELPRHNLNTGKDYKLWRLVR